MKLILVLLALAGIVTTAMADPVPLPRPRPAIPTVPPAPRSFAEAVAGLGIDATHLSSAPTPCDGRLAGEAAITLLPRLIGPGACGGHDLVRLDAVLLSDGGRVAIEPPAVLNCPMAESLAGWLRQEVAPRVAKLGSRLAALQNYDSYECRTRNRIPGAKISEHAHGDALDVRALRLADGRDLVLTDKHVDKTLRAGLRDSACHRFTTVLGPGEAYHSGHIHLDDIARHNGYRICEWDVLTPAPPPSAVAAAVPLPRPRPALATAH